MTATTWPLIVLTVGAGIVGAFQVGKVPVALPALRAELGLGLVGAAWVLSLFNLVGLGAGIAIGGFVARAGARRMVTAGLVIMALSGALGATAGSGTLLLATRFVEGIGFLMVIVGAPTIITGLAAARDMKLALALWSTYMPAGQAIMLVASPALLAAAGWRGLWLANSALLLLYAALLWRCTPSDSGPRSAPRAHLLAGLRQTITAPGPLTLALAFACYSLQYLVVIGFLPTILVEREGLSAASAGALSALLPAANVAGNLAGGVLLHRGAARWVLIAVAGLVMGLSGIGIFSAGLSLWPSFALCLVFAGVGGMLPATVLGAVPAVSPAPHLVPMVNGLLVQGSNLGQVIGPPSVGALATAMGGWASAPVVLASAAAISIGAALCQRRIQSGVVMSDARRRLRLR